VKIVERDADDSLPEIERLLRRNLSSNGALLVSLKFGRKKFARDDLHHRCVTAEIKTADGIQTERFWLKQRPGIDKIFPLLSALKEADSLIPFPHAIARWANPAGSSSVLVTECVNGRLLRNLVIRSMASPKLLREVAKIFIANGTAMARFHNASPASGRIDAERYISNIAERARTNTWLESGLKLAVLRNLNLASEILRGVSLDVILVHHDWTLRNIFVDENWQIRVVDFDSMLAPNDIAALDAGCFLLNLESQLKWWPIVRRSVLKELWRVFAESYRRTRAPIEFKDERSFDAILYCVRLCYFIGGYFRAPIHESFDSAIGHRFVTGLRKNLAAGHTNMLQSGN
jgi:Phosphotransferase enzyme family